MGIFYILSRFIPKGKYSRYVFLAAMLIFYAINYTNFSFADTFDKIRGTVQTNDPGLYEVTYVDDGDTIRIDMNGKSEQIRFIGIDTPEKGHPEKPVQCFAEAATVYLRDLIGDSKVRLESDPQNSNRDIYDRLLRFVYLPDGTFLNLKMIEDGYGFAFTQYPSAKNNEFIAAEEAASEARIGLWSSCDVENDGGRFQTNPA